MGPRGICLLVETPPHARFRTPFLSTHHGTRTLGTSLFPAPQFTLDAMASDTFVSVLGKTLLDGLRVYAAKNSIEIEGLPKDPNAETEQILNVFRNALAIYFPCWHPPRELVT